LKGTCLYFGETLAPARIYLTGHVAIEHGDSVVTEREFPGRQGRLAFVYLTVRRDQPTSRAEITSLLWPDQEPIDPDTALSAILSKLRRLLRRAGWEPSEAAIDVCSGSVSLRLPADTWIDLEAAGNAVDEAEGELRAGHRADAWAHANVAVTIGRRALLPDFSAPWLEARRTALRDGLARGLQCLATVSAANGEAALAVQYAAEAVALEPFRETGYQSLMRLHFVAGDRAEALRVFARCRELLREELGASPSPQTEAVFLEILRAEAR
jgi:SARP family transcriptional regulator, regulator of embCAB operon